MDKLFTRITGWSPNMMGKPRAFVISCLFAIVWVAAGPMLGYSNTWQLIINTATTALTFLAALLIQNSQNRDGAAMQTKLDELLRAVEKARAEFVGSSI